jgi:hypothetical protein
LSGEKDFPTSANQEAAMRRKPDFGSRCFNGKWYDLAGRGKKEDCQRYAIELRNKWKFVRIIRLSTVFNDYGIYVFEEI